MTPDQHARAKELFAAVTRLPADQRDAFLGGQTEETPEVIDEVQSLLKHHRQQTLLAQRDDTQPYVSASGPASGPRTTQAWSARNLWNSWATAATQGGGGRPVLSPRGYLALGIVLACLLLGLVNFLSRLATNSAIRELRTSTLASGLDVTVTALELWIEQEKTKVEAVARDPELRRHSQQLIELKDSGASTEVLIDSSSQRDIRAQLEADFHQDVKYVIFDRRFEIVASGSADATGIGAGVSSYGAGLLANVFNGKTVILLPGHDESITSSDAPAPLQPIIGLIAPIRDEQSRVIAAILVHGIKADERFNEILSLVQYGQSGETYAFDKSGLMISNSRFKQQGLRLRRDPSDAPGSSARLYVRDPGGDLTRGYQPSSPPETWQLTEMARYATAGKDGVNLTGYRDYRGVMVVGAWKWLDEYDFGIATELDVAELEAALRPLKVQSAVKFFLLAGAIGGAVYSYYSLARLRRQIGSRSQIGQYTLQEKIGEGGMGVVYRAQHALLKRPTAIKLLKADLTNARTIAWFEREAQLASQLTHPNTIAIYDYGVTPEGVFYYVMEFVDGVNLVEVVHADGALAVERVARILRQVCGSLREAHQIGLVHRDIKPQNIMLARRAGETDVVKVLDFGLVKATADDDGRASTVLAGTPLYMAPERISSPGQNDPRIDIYSLGAVGFFLLTGREIFVDIDSQGVLQHVLNTVPPRVSECAPGPIPRELDELIAQCLAKDPRERPADVDAVLAVLQAITLSTVTSP